MFTLRCMICELLIGWAFKVCPQGYSMSVDAAIDQALGMEMLNAVRALNTKAELKDRKALH